MAREHKKRLPSPARSSAATTPTVAAFIFRSAQAERNPGSSVSRKTAGFAKWASVLPNTISLAEAREHATECRKQRRLGFGLPDRFEGLCDERHVDRLDW
jgi:hypothetical protein